jgi:hypothetical protein
MASNDLGLFVLESEPRKFSSCLRVSVFRFLLCRSSGSFCDIFTFVDSAAQQYLENYIYQRFRDTSVTIQPNPYQGLKP